MEALSTERASDQIFLVTEGSTQIAHLLKNEFGIIERAPYRIDIVAIFVIFPLVSLNQFLSADVLKAAWIEDRSISWGRVFLDLVASTGLVILSIRWLVVWVIVHLLVPFETALLLKSHGYTVVQRVEVIDQLLPLQWRLAAIDCRNLIILPEYLWWIDYFLTFVD